MTTDNAAIDAHVTKAMDEIRELAYRLLEATADGYENVRPDNDVYPHPGGWLWTEPESEELWYVESAVATLMCGMGQHRWITIFPTPRERGYTKCWYCEVRKA